MVGFSALNNEPPNGGRRMRTEEAHYLKGTFSFVTHLQPDFRFEEGGKWSTRIHLVGAELDKFRELQAKGIKNTLKKDNDGWYATLSRKCQYIINGRSVGRDPPEVFRMEGENKIPIKVKVGDGSTGVAKVILWRGVKYPGVNLRWEAIKIDSLVPFNYDDDMNDALHELVDETPETLF